MNIKKSPSHVDKRIYVSGPSQMPCFYKHHTNHDCYQILISGVFDPYVCDCPTGNLKSWDAQPCFMVFRYMCSDNRKPFVLKTKSVTYKGQTC